MQRAQVRACVGSADLFSTRLRTLALVGRGGNSLMVMLTRRGAGSEGERVACFKKLNPIASLIKVTKTGAVSE